MAVNVVTDLGVNNLGTADVTPIINAALASPPDDALYLPAGEYRIDGTIVNPRGVKIFGDGSSAQLRANGGTGDVVQLAGEGAELTGVRFNPLVPRTGGYNVRMTGLHTRLDDFYMTQAFNAVAIDSECCVTVSRGSIRDTNTAGVCIDVLRGFDVSLRDIIADNPTNAQPQCGIRVFHTGDLTIEDCNIIRSGYDLALCPGNGQVVSSVFVNNTFLDTATMGALIKPNGSGSVVRCIFDQVWMSSHKHQGIMVDAPTGLIDGIDISTCHILGNGTAGQADGLYAGPRVKNVNVLNSVVAGNSGAGVSIAAGAMGGKIIGNTLGASHGFGPNLMSLWMGGGASQGWLVSQNKYGTNVNGPYVGLGAGNLVTDNL